MNSSARTSPPRQRTYWNLKLPLPAGSVPIVVPATFHL
jgi:hypothetical protein